MENGVWKEGRDEIRRKEGRKESVVLLTPNKRAPWPESSNPRGTAEMISV